MHPLHIKNKPDDYELTLQKGPWRRPLFVLLGGFLLVAAVTLLSSLLFADFLAGLSTFISISVDVVAIAFLLAGERTQGRLFFIESSFLLLILVALPWLGDLSPPLFWLGGCVLLFIVLFVVTYNTASSADRRTRKSIDKFSLAISEERVTIGAPFMLSYQLFFKRPILIKDLHITLSYQQYTGRESYGEDAYAARSLSVHQKTDVLGDPANPLVEEFAWTIPESLNAPNRERHDWYLEVFIHPHKGGKMQAAYPLRVLSRRPDADEEPEGLTSASGEELERFTLDGEDGFEGFEPITDEELERFTLDADEEQKEFEPITDEEPE